MKTISRFRRDTKGGVALMFALAAVPVFLAAGMAVDFARAFDIRTRVQVAIDAGALAASASRTLSDAARKELALEVFGQNFGVERMRELGVDPSVNIVDGSVSMSASLNYPTAFMQLAGIDTMDLGASVEVAIPGRRKAEVALVLDYSESMTEVAGGKVKYIAMREAASKLVDDLTEKGTNDDVKFGLVPFSHHVYATLPGEYVVGQKAGKSWTGCTQDRKYPYNQTDATPKSKDDDTKWGQPQAPDHIKYGCSPYAPNKLVVKPISTDVAGVKKQLQDMKPYMYTHISLGFEFGWHLLSPNAPFGGVAPYGDDDVVKVLVLLTDGRQTEPGFGAGGKRNVASAEKNLSALCENAKGKGVKVITVAFDLQDKPTRDRLQGCASDPDKDFFVADDNKDLAQAFESIKGVLAEAIHISR
ncbi:MAG: TadE/TadG family type IV pilus assembly protein [Parvibaculaceae bacterium]